MAERGRPAGFKMSDEHRTKIANSKILSRLIACAEGEIEMTATQAQIGLALMKKVMPDLQAMTIEGGDNPLSVLSEIKVRFVSPGDQRP